MIIYQNCIFNNEVYSNNEVTIRGLQSNGEIIFNDNSITLPIIFSFLNPNNPIFIINNIPIKIDFTNENIMSILIDNNNKLYLQEYNSILRKKFNFLYNDNLNIINIVTNSINQYNSPLIISSINQTSDLVNILIGNKYSLTEFKSNILLSINSLLFNNTLNDELIINNYANTQNEIVTEKIIVGNQLITNNNTIFSSPNIIINHSLNITNNDPCIIQGSLTFNDTLNLSINNQTNTNLNIFENNNNVIFPQLFLGQNSNSTICSTTIHPAINTIETNQIESNKILTILTSPYNNSITIGNLNNNINFLTNNIIFEDIISGNQNINFIFNNRNYFDKIVNFSIINEVSTIIGNNNVYINCSINLNKINLTGQTFLPNIPIMNNFIAYIGINVYNNIGYLTAIPIDTIKSKNINNIESKIFKDINTIKKKIKKIDKEKIIFIKEYETEKKENIFLKKKLFYFLKQIDKKNINNIILKKFIKLLEGILI
jgi:hypothetical protein